VHKEHLHGVPRNPNNQKNLVRLAPAEQIHVLEMALKFALSYSRYACSMKVWDCCTEAHQTRRISGKSDELAL
jgi:hypothetical protein